MVVMSMVTMVTKEPGYRVVHDEDEDKKLIA